MYFRWTTIAIASIIGVVHAVPCSDMAWPTLVITDDPKYDLMHSVKYPDPLWEDGPWDIVKATDCWVRFQVPKEGQTRKSARITKTEFLATPEQVSVTMNNYFGSENNIMLWLPMATKAFQYANILQGQLSLGQDWQAVDGQSSLDVKLTEMSIILPSGAAKLTEVNPPPDCDWEKKRNHEQAQSVGIVGLKGTIATSDWAYAPAAEARAAMIRLRSKQAKTSTGKDKMPGWMLAEKADGNCVVIDFTNFMVF